MDLRGVKIGTLLGGGIALIIVGMISTTIYSNYLSEKAQNIIENSSRRTFDVLTIKRDADEFFASLDETVVLIKEHEIDNAWNRTVAAFNRVQTTLNESRQKEIFTEGELERAENIIVESNEIATRYFGLKRELIVLGVARGRTFEGGYSNQSRALSSEFDMLTQKKFEMLGVVTNVIFRSDKEAAGAMSLVQRSQVVSWVVLAISLVLSLVLAFYLVRSAKKIFDLKNEFINIIAHDLRNPVTAILGYLDIITTDKDMKTTDIRKQLKIVEVATHRLRSQINNLLEVGRSEAGYVKINLEPVVVAPLLRESVVRAKAFADTKGMEIIYDEPIGEDVHILADRHKFSDVIDNLISNAIKYNKKEGLVTVTAGITGDNLTIAVTDTGYGIPEDKKDKIFKKYSRLESSSKERVGGTGLGLYTAKMSMEQMKGKISYETQVNKGTTFTIWFKRAKGA